MIRNAVVNRTLMVLKLHFFCARKRAAAEAAWEVEWERTVKAAEQEGQVVVYKIATIRNGRPFRKDFRKSKSF